jgi:hypothetical protein
MDLSLAFQLLVFTPLLLVPVLAYLIVGRLFKVKDKPLKIISSLVISLAFASIFPVILEWAPHAYKYIDNGYLPAITLLSPVFPWTDCNNEVPGACSCPEGALCDCAGRIGYLICRLLQYYEWALIAVAMIFIVASFLISGRAKKK